jgi:hypothetical protein
MPKIRVTLFTNGNAAANIEPTSKAPLQSLANLHYPSPSPGCGLVTIAKQKDYVHRNTSFDGLMDVYLTEIHAGLLLSFRLTPSINPCCFDSPDPSVSVVSYAHKTPKRLSFYI